MKKPKIRTISLSKLSIYDMDLHESVQIRNDHGQEFVITRVINGYLYTIKGATSSTFVQWNTEFRGDE